MVKFWFLKSLPLDSLMGTLVNCQISDIYFKGRRSNVDKIEKGFQQNVTHYYTDYNYYLIYHIYVNITVVCARQVASVTSDSV